MRKAVGITLALIIVAAVVVVAIVLPPSPLLPPDPGLTLEDVAWIVPGRARAAGDDRRGRVRIPDSLALYLEKEALP